MSADVPPPVKNYVDREIGRVRGAVEGRLDAIDQKLAGDLVRFDALGKRIDDQGEAIHRRIDDVRGDVRDLGSKMDTQHRERMSLAQGGQPGNHRPAGEAGSPWATLPSWIRWTILLGVGGGTVIGGALIAVLKSGVL